MHTATHLSEQRIAALPVLRVPLTRPFVWLSQGWAALIVTLVSFGFATFSRHDRRVSDPRSRDVACLPRFAPIGLTCANDRLRVRPRYRPQRSEVGQIPPDDIDLDAAILASALRSAVIGDRILFAQTFGTQTGWVDSAVDQRLHDGLCTLPR